MKISFFFFCFLYLFDFYGQKGSYYGNTTDASQLCQIRVEAVNHFTTNSEAEKALDKIISVTGISKRFVLYQCNGIENCEAITFNGIRYIFYDSDFMKDISDNIGSSWSNISILAHEVGHHVNGHSLDWLSIFHGKIKTLTLEEKRLQELEADEFSGFVMYKLGATLFQSQLAVNAVSNDNDDTYSTHPNKTKRLKAIEKGYQHAKEKSQSFEVKTLTANDYFYMAYNASDKEYQYKIDNYSKAIELDSKDPIYYFNRGVSYYYLMKYDEAIIDYNRAIELDSTFEKAYNNRGIIYAEKGNYQDAINNYTRSIEFNPKNIEAYNNRGNSFINLGKYQKAILDLNEAIELDSKFSIAYNNRGVAYEKSGNYSEAIVDYTKAININPLNLLAYINRGKAKEILGMDFCSDFIKACELGDSVGCLKIKEKRCSEVIENKIFTDNRDKNTYKIISIGTQTWMANNLNVSKFRNGDLIPEVKSPIDWQLAYKNKQPAWCYYKNDSVFGEIYGKLYNWYAVIDRRGLAPIGWHIPKEKEWELFINYLGGEKAAFEKIRNKEKSISGLNIFPTGRRVNNGSFDNIEQYIYYWSQSKCGDDFGYMRGLSLIYGFIDSHCAYSGTGLSVRCIKD
jgi:uncharacterized protein (TIGR02145 family)